MIDINYILLIFGGTVLFIFGLHKTTREGMIFEKLASTLDKRIPEFWMKPVFNCPPCMSSLWGSISFLLFFGIDDIIFLPAFVFCLAGLNSLIINYQPCCDE